MIFSTTLVKGCVGIALTLATLCLSSTVPSLPNPAPTPLCPPGGHVPHNVNFCSLKFMLDNLIRKYMRVRYAHYVDPIRDENLRSQLTDNATCRVQFHSQLTLYKVYFDSLVEIYNSPGRSSGFKSKIRMVLRAIVDVQENFTADCRRPNATQSEMCTTINNTEANITSTLGYLKDTYTNNWGVSLARLLQARVDTLIAEQGSQGMCRKKRHSMSRNGKNRKSGRRGKKARRARKLRQRNQRRQNRMEKTDASQAQDSDTAPVLGPTSTLVPGAEDQDSVKKVDNEGQVTKGKGQSRSDRTERRRRRKSRKGNKQRRRNRKQSKRRHQRRNKNRRN